MDGRHVLVGDDVASRPDAHWPFADGRLPDPEALPLVAEALWQSGVQGEVALGSGMPLGMFARERDAAQRAWEGRTLHPAVGAQAREVQVARVVLRPQGGGAALWLVHKEKLPASEGLVAIVDVGTRTTDVLVLQSPRMAPVPRLSWSFEAGVATAANGLAAKVAHDTGHALPPDLAAKALVRPVRWAGTMVGGPDVARPFLTALAARVRADVRRRLASDAHQVVHVALVGGGATLLDLRDIVPGAEVAQLSPEESLFANALGFGLAAERAVGAAGMLG